MESVRATRYRHHDEKILTTTIWGESVTTLAESIMTVRGVHLKGERSVKLSDFVS